FWLVLITALLSVVLGYLAGEAARRLGDARLFLVSLAFVTSAGFLALHALATPGVLLEGKNAGFVVATPVGLLIAGLFAAASAVDLSPERSAAIMRRHVLMAAAFGIVAFAARNEYRRRHSTAAVFKDLYLEHTAELVDRRYAGALSELVDSLEGGEAPETALATIRSRNQLSDEEATLLERAAGELRRLDQLFSPYLSPQLRTRLRDQPGAAELGGEERDVSVLFADLQGFTAFSERSTPPEVVAMLNAYWAKVVPVVGAEDGMIERFAGDAVMVVFNAAADQPDHALRASRAALAFADASEAVVAGRP